MARGTPARSSGAARFSFARSNGREMASRRKSGDPRPPRHLLPRRRTENGCGTRSSRRGLGCGRTFRSGAGGGYAGPTPVTDGKLVYCVFGSAVIAALDFQGKIVWRKEIVPRSFDVTVGSSPILYQDTVILLLRDGRSQRFQRGRLGQGQRRGEVAAASSQTWPSARVTRLSSP